MLVQGKGIPHVGKLYCCSAPYQTLQHQQPEALCGQSQRVQAALTELLVQHVEVVAGQSLAVLGGMHSTYIVCVHVCTAETRTLSLPLSGIQQFLWDCRCAPSRVLGAQY